jgi:hypothetical protein
MTKISRELKHLVMLPLCALFFFIGVITVHAATYYVATTGNDTTGDGSSGNPWRNPQKCVSSGTPLVAGDTCTVADGTYTDTDGNGVVIYISSSSPQGSAGNPITIKSTNPLGAVISIPSTAGGNSGFYVARSYYVIEGFNITGGTSTLARTTGVNLSSLATGAVVRKNRIHDIGRTVCTTAGNAFTGIYSTDNTGILIESNRIYTIGRLRVGENGCGASVSGDHNDHGIYMSGGTNPTIRRNVIYDVNRGWPIHLYGGTITNLSIYNNTLAGKSSTGSPAGQIILASTITTANIKNNIFYDPQSAPLTAFSVTASNVSINYNLTDSADANIFFTSVPSGVTVGGNNLLNTSPGFVDAAGKAFNLNAGSAAINAGTNVGILVKDGAPDIGAYEFLEGGEDIAPPLSPQNLSVH